MSAATAQPSRNAVADATVAVNREAERIVGAGEAKQLALELKAAQGSIRRLEGALESHSESNRLERMRQDLELATAKTKAVRRTIIAGGWVAFFQECQRWSCGQAEEVAAGSVRKIKQAEECTREMEGIVIEGKAERRVLQAALDAAEDRVEELEAAMEQQAAARDKVRPRSPQPAARRPPDSRCPRWPVC